MTECVHCTGGASVVVFIHVLFLSPDVGLQEWVHETGGAGVGGQRRRADSLQPNLAKRIGRAGQVPADSDLRPSQAGKKSPTADSNSQEGLIR